MDNHRSGSVGNHSAFARGVLTSCMTGLVWERIEMGHQDSSIITELPRPLRRRDFQHMNTIVRATLGAFLSSAGVTQPSPRLCFSGCGRGARLSV